MSSDAISAFIQGAPPGELPEVLKSIRTISPSSLSSPSAHAALRTYHEAQLSSALLGSKSVLISQYNRVNSSDREGTYFDAEAKTEFTFDYETGKAKESGSWSGSSHDEGLVSSLNSALKKYVSEHFLLPTSAVIPTGDEVAICIVSNKYSPSNFFNGRWRSVYTYSPSSKTLKGAIKVEVHYYEDGNVRLSTSKDVSLDVGSDANGIVRAISAAENAYNTELVHAFDGLNEGAFKNLRRQLPVTRQKVKWEAVGNYRLGQAIGGGGLHVDS